MRAGWGEEIKLSEYADDTTLILDGSEESLRESLKLLDNFGKMSGLKLNSGKTEALWIGSKTNCSLRLCPEKNFKYLDNKNCGHWKLFFDVELKKYGGKAVFQVNLNKTDTSN